MLSNRKDFFGRVKEKINQLISIYKNYIEETKYKLRNMYDTNYNIGMYHLEHGNLWDATFRFKIIKRFWPDRLEAQYQYAYCLILQEMNRDAIVLLNEILSKDPNFAKAQDLLNKINNGESQQMVKEYKEKFKQDSDNK